MDNPNDPMEALLFSMINDSTDQVVDGTNQVDDDTNQVDDGSQYFAQDVEEEYIVQENIAQDNVAEVYICLQSLVYT